MAVMNFPQAVTLLVLRTMLLGYVCKGDDWAHETILGPDRWSEIYPECGGRRQSPINIDTRTTVSRIAPDMFWNNYDVTPARMQLYNDGHTLKLFAFQRSSQDIRKPTITMGSRVYALNETHFHFGKTVRDGSEHTIDSKRYALEIHAYHNRLVNGLATGPEEIVVSYLCEALGTSNVVFDRVLRSVVNVTTPYTRVNIPPFPLNELLSEFTSNYYLYRGSLTTPPCTEAITFLISKEILTIGRTQLAIFRKLLNLQNNPMGGNTRPLQPINRRTVVDMVDNPNSSEPDY